MTPTQTNMIDEVVDTHLHVWDPSKLRYPWLDDIPLLNKRYVLADYDVAKADVPVTQMVFVQCEVDPRQFREEAAWVGGLADRDPRIAGIVPWAPLECGDAVASDLDAFAANPLVKGIRRIIQFEDDPAFCLGDGFIRGVRLLGERDLHFEICLKGDEQFRNCLQLVRACPDVRFLLNHVGKPFIVDHAMEPWCSMIEELAALPNTWCKISGMANEGDMDSWTEADLEPYVEAVVGAFGWERVMFGGDWPVALLATTYTRWVDTLQSIARSLGGGKTELGCLFADNARAFYRLSTSA